jgi:putative oxidoreductase
MAIFVNRSSHPFLSYTDRLAASWSDFLLLAARVLIGWLLLASGWSKLMNMSGFAGYLTSLKVPSPGLLQWIAVPEFLLGLALVLGLATRYAALAGFMFVLIATLIGHRYWEFAAPQQTAQYTHFIKNLSIMGGMLLTFVTGGGRYSAESWLARR